MSSKSKLELLCLGGAHVIWRSFVLEGRPMRKEVAISFRSWCHQGWHVGFFLDKKKLEGPCYLEILAISMSPFAMAFVSGIVLGPSRGVINVIRPYKGTTAIEQPPVAGYRTWNHNLEGSWPILVTRGHLSWTNIGTNRCWILCLSFIKILPIGYGTQSSGPSILDVHIPSLTLHMASANRNDPAKLRSVWPRHPELNDSCRFLRHVLVGTVSFKSC